MRLELAQFDGRELTVNGIEGTLAQRGALVLAPLIRVTRQHTCSVARRDNVWPVAGEKGMRLSAGVGGEELRQYMEASALPDGSVTGQSGGLDRLFGLWFRRSFGMCPAVLMRKLGGDRSAFVC